MADLERIYVIPLRGAYEGVRTKRSRKAVKIVRGFIARHMKAEEEEVSISEAVNALIWKRGIQKPPRKIKVRAVKSGDAVNVMLLDEKEAPKEEKPKAGPKKEEEKTGATEPKEVTPKEPEKAEVPKPEAKKEEPKPTPEKKAEVPAQKPKEPKKEETASAEKKKE